MNVLSSNTRIYGYLLLAGALFSLELLLGVGLIGISVGLTVATVQILLSWKEPVPRRGLRIGGVFLALALATFGWLALNAALGRRNAIPIIQACEHFRLQRGRYPTGLNELVPEFLPSIPPARYTVTARYFFYDPDTPGLCFSAMFHGVFCYDLTKKAWTANE